MTSSKPWAVSSKTAARSDVPFTIGELSREPDRWRDAGTTHDKERNSGHWINLDDQGRAVGGPTLAELPDTREAYDTLTRAVGHTQYSAGYLPYNIIDGWQQLVKDFAYWRVDVAATDTATDPARAARFARDRQLREMLILRDVGVWSHYVADASNPMHTTIQLRWLGRLSQPERLFNRERLAHAFRKLVRQSQYRGRRGPEAGSGARIA